MNPVKEKRRGRREAAGQFARFCLVGTSNAVIDFGLLNLLLWLYPTTAAVALVGYNSLAVVAAATNSFFWNRRFTFQVTGPVTPGEITRFAGLAIGTAGLNDLVLEALSLAFPRLMAAGTLGTNVLKVGAIVGAMSLSFFGMRLWVFLRRPARAGEPPSTTSGVEEQETARLHIVAPRVTLPMRALRTD